MAEVGGSRVRLAGDFGWPTTRRRGRRRQDLTPLIGGSLDKRVKSPNGNGFSEQTGIAEFCEKPDFTAENRCLR